MAGGIGGLIGDSCMYPLDTVKTRQQGAPNELKYKSTLKAFRTLLREEGVFRGVYGGYSPAALGSFPSTMTFFLVYESSKRLMINDMKLPEPVAHFTSGFLGDLASSFIYVPSEVLKTRLQLQGRYNNPYFYSGYNYKGMIDAVQTITRKEGFSALFYGYKATLIRDLPFSALQFAFYEKLHTMAQEYVGQNNDMGVGFELATGGIAGGLAGAITTPLDVVKTRIQTQLTDSTSAIPKPSSALLDPAAKTAQTEQPAAPSINKPPVASSNSLKHSPRTTTAATSPTHASATSSITHPPSRSTVIKQATKSYSISSSSTHTGAQAPAILTDSISHGLRIIYKTEGFAGLFSGIWPRVVWTSVQSSVMLLVYQSVLKYLEDGSAAESPF